ncbi:MAG: phosphoenolpyruvate synthase [Arenicellales bacterium WSBS_2016_MAG_OTU3]
MTDYILWFENLSMQDVPRVGGKNASLGEMIANLADAGICVPGGFATTADAFQNFLSATGAVDRINKHLAALNVNDINALAKTGKDIRETLLNTRLPAELEQAIRAAYEKLGGGQTAVAVRSSATAEDLPEASFAGQQETFLNVRGIENVLLAVREVFASLYNDRAIAYRVHQGFAHAEVSLSAGIQRMVRSDIGAAGVMFTLDTESGYEDVVFITSSYGLGECVVQGSVNPDEFYVYKPALANNKDAVLRRSLGSKASKMIYAETGSNEKVKIIDVDKADRERFSLTDADVQALSKMAVSIEQHYKRHMDIEWGKDGEDGKLYILQARPETVRSRDGGQVLERYILNEKSSVLVEGRSIGQRIGSGKVRVIPGIEQLDQVQDGDVLVTDMTDPDWEPVMQRAAAIVTNRGGRTCHAAIIARELGVPAIVGSNHATQVLKTGQAVTVSCAEGDTGFVYAGELSFEHKIIELDKMPELPFKITMNVGNPQRAFDFQKIPNEGVGLARLEFIISNTIGIHPKAALNYATLPDKTKALVDSASAGYNDPVDFYIRKMSEGVATIAAAFAPKPVIVRLSDFKSNEYANLIGGHLYEPDEENPMLGFRGAARYIDLESRACFELECRAMKQVRENMGLTNVWLMVPFVRTISEARQTIALMEQFGLKRGEHELKIMMMCELPSNAILADKFLQHFDGFSIGSNDLTQLTLGLDRDSGLIAHLFDERDEAVKVLLSQAIAACRKANKYVGICGQGPSDHPDLARWLMQQGIESVSLNPDSVVETWLELAV